MNRIATLAEEFFTPHPRSAERAALAASTDHGFDRSALNLNGESLAIYSRGDTGGPSALLVHGWSSHGLRFAPYAEPLAALGLATVSFDQPAHGLSGARRAVGLLDFIHAVLAVAKTLPNLIAVIGHSLGGLAAVNACAAGLRASTLVAIAAPADLHGAVCRFARAHALDEDATAALLQAVEARTEGRRLAELAVEQVAPKLAIGGLVFHDRDDHEVPVADGRRLAAAWRHAQYTESGGLGHSEIVCAPTTICRIVEHLRRA